MPFRWGIVSAPATNQPVAMDFKTFRNNAAGAKTGLLQMRKNINNRISELEDGVGTARKELARVDAELAAMEAFESALASVPAAEAKRRGPKPGTRGKARARKTKRIGRKSVRRVQIVEIINAAGPDGIGRGDIIAKLEADGDAIKTKSDKQSVSNALAAIKNSGEVGYANNKYVAQH